MSAKAHAMVLTALLVAASRLALADNASTPLGGPVLDPPTLHCLGVYWIVGGDDNRNAKVEVDYRPAGGREWRLGPPLFRVEKGANRLEKGDSQVKVPATAWLFAGSVMLLSPDTEYELRLRLSDPDGGQSAKLLKARTMVEPAAPADLRRLHVAPGDGGGSGTQTDPFKGLAAAQSAARPGDLFLLHAGTYVGTFEITRSGQEGKPIVWRGMGDGEVILDGQGKSDKLPERVISASDIHDVWFEHLTIRNGKWGLVAHASARIVVRRCHLLGVHSGITARRNPGNLAGLFICDNVLEGPFKWSDATHGADVEEWRGIELSGSGQVVCYNRVRNFKDGIDTAPGPRCEAIDIHNNEVSECLDDGCEMDGSERNTRCFLNRFTNVFQGVSIQPIHGGPVYIYRNVLYNVQHEPFKMHNSPSGGLFIHNTVVKTGMALTLQTQAKVRNCVTRNNLFIGTTGDYCCENTAPMEGCDFDYDGFSSGPWGKFLKWNNVRYDTFADVKAKAPVYRHAVLVDPATAFASGVRLPDDGRRQYEIQVNDLRLKDGTAAVDAGQVLPGFNDDYQGKAPDLGAYELGNALPHYGPRPRN